MTLPWTPVSEVTLTVVRDELEAEMVLAVLRAHGLWCSYRKTDIAAGAWTLMLALGGPVEVLVHEDDLDTALGLLPD